MYLEMEANPSIEFDHMLCEKLGGMTVDEMRDRMSNVEYVRWQIYYGRKAQRLELETSKAKRGR